MGKLSAFLEASQEAHQKINEDNHHERTEVQAHSAQPHHREHPAHRTENRFGHANQEVAKLLKWSDGRGWDKTHDHEQKQGPDEETESEKQQTNDD